MLLVPLTLLHTSNPMLLLVPWLVSGVGIYSVGETAWAAPREAAEHEQHLLGPLHVLLVLMLLWLASGLPNEQQAPSRAIGHTQADP